MALPTPHVPFFGAVLYSLRSVQYPHTTYLCDILILTFTYLHVRMNAVMLEGLVSHHALHGAQILQSQDFQIHRNFPHKPFSSSCSDVMSWCHCSSPSTVKIGSLAIWEAASASGSFISFLGKCQMSAAQQRAVTLFKSQCLANGFRHLSATIFAFRLWLQGAPRSLRRAHVVPVSWLIAIETNLKKSARLTP